MPDKFNTRSVPRRTTVLTGWCVLVTLAVLVVNFIGPVQMTASLGDAENYAQDYFARTGWFTPANTNLVLIGIDRPSYDDVIFPDDAKNDPVLADLRERFPWSRQVWATVITKLADAGAKAVVIDLVFAAEADGDNELRAALDQFQDRVVVGANLTVVETDRGVPVQLTVPNGGLIPDVSGRPAALDSRVGYVNIWPDNDDVFRRARFRASNHELGDVLSAPAGAVVESLDARAVEKSGVAGKLGVGSVSSRIRFTGPPATWPVISLVDVLTPKTWQRNYGGGSFFRGKIVVIGPTANIFQDFHRTPFRDEMPGPEIHLNIINAALQGEFLRESPPLAAGAFIALAGLLAAVLCQFIRGPIRRLLVIFALGAGVFFAARCSFNHANLIFPVISPLLVLTMIGTGALVYDFVAERLERMKLRHTMGLYFSPRVLDAVLADPGSMKPRRAEVTLLLTDLRNSTPLAEALGPQGMFDLLNRVFEAQTGAIMSEEGNLEHFLGDQFLSYWGAPQAQPDAADRADRAAKKLIRSMEELRATLSPEVQKWFGYGVALHSGRVLVGNKGSALRLDYGLIGDAVNEAARVESLTKYYGVRLLVTRDTFAQFSTQGARRLIDRVIVKGKSEPVELFECENPCTPANYTEICVCYKEAYAKYFLGQFGEARAMFETLAQKFSDGPSQTLAARCAELAESPPAAWNGIWKMESK